MIAKVFMNNGQQGPQFWGLNGCGTQTWLYIDCKNLNPEVINFSLNFSLNLFEQPLKTKLSHKLYIFGV